MNAPANTSEPGVVSAEAQPVIAIRATVAMTELPEFYRTAYEDLAAFAQRHDVTVTGPPYGIAHGMPADTIDVSAALPVAGPVPADDRVAFTALPAGRVATLTATGSYEHLARAYEALLAWISEHGLAPGQLAWEQYIIMGTPGGGAANVTTLSWLLTD